MKSKKSPSDINQSAFSVVQQVTHISEAQPTKNPAAVALGRLGGLKGGRARAAKLSKKRRQEIGRKAIATRWAKTKR